MDKNVKAKLIEKRLSSLYSRLESCDICPRNCKVNRLKGQLGYCGLGKDLKLYTTFLHQGEEPGISEGLGSGTIFFSGCNLKCVYCQNYKFSHLNEGEILAESDLANVMVGLQKQGAANINLVTATPFIPHILKALLLALGEGLNIPIVYNTSGFEKVDIIEQLRGIVDVYLTDLKYSDSDICQRYSNASNYAIFAQEAAQAMNKQISLSLWDKGLLKKALIIRHLVLPSHIDESKRVLSWIKENIPGAYVSVMFQYRPYFKAADHPQINRPLNHSEYTTIKEFVEGLELEGWVQDFNPDQDLAGINFSPNLKIN